MTSATISTHNAKLKLSSSPSSPEARSIACFVERPERQKLIIFSNRPLPASQAVSIEWEDTLFLGETVRCVQDNSEAWRTEVKVEQVLTGLQSLMILLARLLGGAPETEAAFALSGVYA